MYSFGADFFNSIILWRFIEVVCINNVFLYFFSPEYYMILLYFSLSNHSPIEGHLGFSYRFGLIQINLL